jgi:4-amino-4-deoxy-L-arabinose transferase-like glycosyltransferase
MNEEHEIEEFAPWLVLIITVVGGFLRVLLLGTKGMWLDETFSVWLASPSVPEMLQWMVRVDQHPPLYYLLLHYWMARFGDTPYYVRLFSVLFGAGTIPVIYLIGKRMSGVVVGLAAAVLLALSLFHIYFAQVHPPDVQCRRGDLCPGQLAYGPTLRPAHWQPVSGLSACLAHPRTR